MKGILADFTNEDNIQLIGAHSDLLLRNLEVNTMVFQILNQKDKNVSTGYDDTKVPHFQKGIQYYKDNGYKVSIRNSGGRSVVNDPGVLNFSLMFKSTDSIEKVYLIFYRFIVDALKPLNLSIKFGEIKGAYCPGAFDISIDLQKVAGTAQRRVGNNTLVGCYLSVNGDQEARSTLVSNFYKITEGDIEVDPQKMTTLEDKVKRNVSIDEIKTLLINHFKTLVDTTESFDPTQFTQEMVDQAITRNKNQQTHFNL